jgi:hypothetical protein
MLHNENYSNNGIYLKRKNVRSSESGRIRFESHICLSYLELSDKTISTYARDIAKFKDIVYITSSGKCALAMVAKSNRNGTSFLFYGLHPLWRAGFPYSERWR